MNWALYGLGVFWLILTILGFAQEGVSGTAATTLDGTIASTDTSLNVASSRDFPDAGYLVIDEEVIHYTGKTSSSFTGLTRGDRDTAAANHVDGVRVYTELSGLVNLGLDFSAVESNIPLIGPAVSLAVKTWVIIKFVGKIITLDWPYWDAVILGFPIQLFQVVFAIGNIAFLLRVAYDIKQVINPFS